mmetsp:Transcript_23526/g.50979  ORF Transcript_23526/g.50979 Transcript_23526/m.50979 type:complete len:201 (+) Transcript_23526:134-736(+)|eukprot:CAMPEP_0172312648 /NCGR_PEP_ID=MMETSP1058-20130122/18244_1 /TAXON_ID=83371 /ORGANISM="Detonula confervacea, Strain CCMP 353" /LENGTH=200 /DNA_ID=CAMNT_0013026171 /DNA_START=43 /DNA_END=645 /DNA_ORIENTATION=+
MAGATDIEINDSDIICGRKGVALKQPGNLAYRKVVSLNKELYATCLKNEKLKISKSIVAAMREVGGRFLEREDGKTSTSLDEKDKTGDRVVWRDIGDKRAIEKTSQALREGQPKLLKKLALKHVNAVSPPQLHRNHSATLAINPAVAAPNYRYNPCYVPQMITPPPSTLLSPHYLSQLSQIETDLLFLALLRRANGRFRP